MLFSAETIMDEYCRAPAAVMTSGGVDSACLAHLAAKKLGRILLVHVNHRIRPEAEADAAFVRRMSEALGCGFKLYEADIPAMAADSGRSIETEAREYRRQVMRSLAGEGLVVMTAHHADDNAETVLMHILRGSGIRGLIGMRVCDGGVVRPFLHTTRAEIETYARENGVRFVTDATNADEAYTRNFVRRSVIPLLNERFAASAALNRLAQNAAETEDYLTRRLDRSLLVKGENTVSIGLEAFREPALAARYVREAFEAMGVTEDVDTAAVGCVCALAYKDNGKRTSARGLTAVREYDRITLYFETCEPLAPEPFAVRAFPAYGVEFAVCAPRVEKGRLRFDPDRLPPGACVRYRRNGDLFRPFGSGTKSLREYLIDKKIPVRLRDKIPLIAEGNIVYVVCGVEIGDEVKLENAACAVECYRSGEDK